MRGDALELVENGHMLVAHTLIVPLSAKIALLILNSFNLNEKKKICIRHKF